MLATCHAPHATGAPSRWLRREACSRTSVPTTGCTHATLPSSRPCNSSRRWLRKHGNLAAAQQQVVTVVVPAESDKPSVAPEEESSSSSYVWTRNWWPLVPVSYLDSSRPKAMTVMGVQVVVWRDGQGQWRCFKDACPHRLAPLSEGRVESDGTLLCAYHAWRFDGQGACTTIPQATSQEAEATARASKRSCATAFPTQERAGLLWVWPDDSPSRWVEAAASPVVVPDVVQQRWDREGEIHWFMRDLPYSYEVLLENLTDPAHVPVSHHKLVPMLNRYNIRPMAFEADSKPESALGMDTGVEPTASYRHNGLEGAMEANRMLRFTAPSHVQYMMPGKSTTQLYCVPVAPGRSRVLHVDLFNFAPVAAAGLAQAFKMLVFRLIMKLQFTTANRHLMMLKLFDGDSIFLNMQEHTLLREHGGNWRRAYFMPAPCDKGVATALSWVDSVGHPFPFTAAQPQGPLDRRVLLDRYSQHTAHCPTCQQQVRKLERIAQLARAFAAACFLAACTLAGSAGLQGLVTASAPFVTPAAGGLVLLVGVAAWAATGLVGRLEAARQQFFFTDYVHADID